MLEETLQVLYGRLILELLNFTLSPGHTVPQLIVERSQPKEAQHDCKRSAWRDLGQQLTCMVVCRWVVGRALVCDHFVHEELLVRIVPRTAEKID